MTRVLVNKDCGNSPKNTLLQQFTIAIARRDTKFILDTIADPIRWNFVGDRVIEGREDLVEFLKKVKKQQGHIVNDPPYCLPRKSWRSRWIAKAGKWGNACFL